MTTELRIRTGGLYRCCIASLEDSSDSRTAVEGQTTQCKYCHANILFRDGAWEWVLPKDAA